MLKNNTYELFGTFYENYCQLNNNNKGGKMLKKKLFRTLLLSQVLIIVPMLLNASSHDISGEWNGCISYANNDCNINLEISTDDGGNFIAVLDIPVQDIENLSADICVINNNEIIIEHISKGIVFKGEIKDNSIEGIWKQQGMSLSLSFERLIIESGI